MTIKQAIRALLGIAATFMMLSCTNTHNTSELGVRTVEQTSHQDRLQSIYSELGKTGGKVFTLNPKLSAVKIYAFRAGTAAKLGHNHVLSSPQFSGFVYLPRDGTSGARFDLEFRLDQLEIDNPENRSNLGSAFSSTPTPGSIKRTRDHMLGEDNFQADQFPFVRIHASRIAGEAPKLAAEVQVELHGQQREMWVPLNVEGLPDRILVTGSLVLRQSEFGVHPYSVLGGFLAVQDEVVIEFSLLAQPLQ
jgi:hypothetical protein